MAVIRTAVDISWTGSGSPGVNTWHMRVDNTSAPGLADMETLMGFVEDFYASTAGLFPSTCNHSWSGEWQTVGTEDPEAGTTTGWSVNGSASSGYAPMAVAIVAGWRTSSPTRSGRGRTFLSPLASNTLDSDGSPTGSAITTVSSAQSDLVAASIGVTLAALGVWSPTDNELRDFTGWAVRDTYAVLRSRRD